MRFVVYGAGAVGGVVGARLFAHGHDVVLVARGEHGAAIRERGLRVDSPDGSENLPIPVVDHPDRLTFATGDVVLLAMKTHDTASAVSTLAAVAPPSTPIVCVQNGVENERLALRRFAQVYGVCVMCPTGHLEPGVVAAYSSPITGLLDVGRYPSGTDDLVDSVTSALTASTFDALPRPDIMRWKYAKLLMNLGNAAEALIGTGAFGETAGDPDGGAAIARLARREGVACLEAAGIAFASQEEDAARRGDLLRRLPVAGTRRGGGSSWQSLERRAGTIETDYLNGEIVLLGRQHGVPTPVNELLQRLANDLARRGEPPGSVSAGDFMSQLEGASSPTA